MDCSSLTSIVIPDSVTSIGTEAFMYCSSLESVTIGSGVTYIDRGRFERCSSLTNIDVSSNNSTYSSLDGILFNKDKTELIYCPQGKSGSYTIPNSVTSIGEGAFSDTAYYNDENNWENGVLYIDNCLIEADPDNLPAEYEIKSGTRCIADSAFTNCSSLESVVIPNGVTSIGSSAFYDCSKLYNVKGEFDRLHKFT